LNLALAVLILADLSFVPFALVLVLVGGLQAFVGLNGHPSAGGSRPAFLLGALVIGGGGILIASGLIWLTRLVMRMRRTV